MTTAVSNNQWESMGGVRRRSAASSGDVRPATRSLSASLWSLGVITLLISAWGGIIPYLGPTFGFSADGSPSWSWSLTHTVLALAPGALGCLVAFSFLAPLSPTAVGRRRASLSLAGLVAVVCGAWFVVGPLAWPIVHNTGAYFVAAAPLRGLANQVGYSFGPGLILAACGAFAMGWAVRHNRPLEAAGSDLQPAPEESAIIRTEPVSTPLAPSMPAATAAPVAPVAAESVASAQSAAPVESAAPAAPARPSETAPTTSPATPPSMNPAQTGIPAPDPDRAL